MPKETFFNLPEDKRAIIEEAALKEFAQAGYDMASINRIVERSKIAKGSFYQYFEDKKDLFFHLLDISGNKKMAYIAPVLANIDQFDFFTLIREIFYSGIDFALENPEGAKIGEWLLKNSKHEMFTEMMNMASPKANEFFMPMLKSAQNKGEIRANLDIGFLSHLITALSTTVLEYYYNSQDSPSIVDKDKMMQYLDMMIDVLKFGLK